MTLPAFLFGCLIAILLGSLFHLWRGGSFWHIVLYILFSIAGFWLGHLIASIFHIQIWNIGPIRFGPSLLFDIMFLFLAQWLFRVTPQEQT
jgi:ABC-type dipeptide/oligopeptide/nickel transport system permease component